jgi:carboxyl-terminal processing protease
VGAIAFSVWMTAVAEPFAQAIDAYRHDDGLIIDLRGNPGGLADMIRGLAGHVLSEPASLGRMKMRDLELEFRVNPRRSTSDGRSVEPYAGPVAILVDDLTGSASECFAGGLQSLGRARVFGTTSLGEALPAVTRQLPNGDVLLYAVGDFVTATGERLEGKGVVPDETVPLTASALANGRDPVIDAALAWVDRQSTAR